LKKIIIFGTDDFAQVAHFYFSRDSDYKVVAFTAHERFLKQKTLLGLPVLPFEKITSIYPPSKFSMFIAIAYSKVNKVRARVFEEAKSKGYRLVSYVNSKVTKWEEVKMGENCFIFENVVIQPFVKFGDDVIVWSGNHIGHHSKIGNHCFITSHVVISGNVRIGDYCFLGVNSTIRDGITIADHCVIGAGAVILKNTKQREVYTTKGTQLLPIKSDQLKSL
jgi:sugar O-acyltransferase (sialic acid O-acetyltransferase NeuD family)